VNSLDRKADISTYQNAGQSRAGMWTAIGLSIVGALVIVLIAVLCWLRQRNRRLRAAAGGATSGRGRSGLESAFGPNSIRIDPKSPIHAATVVNETEQEERDNRWNARMESANRYDGGNRNAQQWIFANGRHGGATIVEM